MRRWFHAKIHEDTEQDRPAHEHGRSALREAYAAEKKKAEHVKDASAAADSGKIETCGTEHGQHAADIVAHPPPDQNEVFIDGAARICAFDKERP